MTNDMTNDEANEKLKKYFKENSKNELDDELDDEFDIKVYEKESEEIEEHIKEYVKKYPFDIEWITLLGPFWGCDTSIEMVSKLGSVLMRMQYICLYEDLKQDFGLSDEDSDED